MFNKGIHETLTGHKAILAQIRPVGQNNWILRGAIEENGVLFIHTWDVNGHSNSGFPAFNLLEKPE